MSINHGTTGGYYAHRRLSETPCQPCRDAIAEYTRSYREKNTSDGGGRGAEKIRRKALAILRDKHREEYESLVVELREEARG